MVPWLLLCSLVGLAYGPAVPNFFASDDLDMLSGDASDLLSPASGFGRFMPLAAIVHRVMAVAFGLDPIPAHTLQLALHMAATLLVYVLARRLLAGWSRGDEHVRVPSKSPPAARERSFCPEAGEFQYRRSPTAAMAAIAGGADHEGTTGAALVAAVLFALYPRHHQVVMWFGAVSIALAATLALATAVLFLRAWPDRDPRAGWAAAATYAAALLAHESAVALPLLLVALAVYAPRRAAPEPATAGPGLAAIGRGTAASQVGSGSATLHGAAIRPWGGLCAVPAWLWAMALASGAHLALLGWAYRVRAAAYPDSGYRFLGASADLAVAPLRYAAQWGAPPPWTDSLTLGGAGLALGGLALLGAAAWAWRGGAAARLGLAWVALAAAPFVLFGVYGVTDRYYYLPSVGLALAVAAALGRLGWRQAPLVAAYSVVAVLLLAVAAGQWRLAGARVHGTMDYLAAWSATQAAPVEAAAFVGVPFKRGEGWPGSQVYVFSTGLVGAAHLATGRPTLRVSYVFADEYPALGAWLDALPTAPGPPGLALFALDRGLVADHSDVLGAALPELARLRWRGASRTPIDWLRYAPLAWTGQERSPATTGR